jgi:hypothetical protein
LSILDSVRKGFSFFLMSMGVSTYDKKKPVAPDVKPSTDVMPTKPE